MYTFKGWTADKSKEQMIADEYVTLTKGEVVIYIDVANHSIKSDDGSVTLKEFEEMRTTVFELLLEGDE